MRRIPPSVSFILRYLAGEISKKRHYKCGTRITTADRTPRVDAQASNSRTGIGGWFPARDQDGHLSPWLSSWFYLEIAQEDFPWILEKENRPSLLISDTLVLIVPSITDNRGNGAALNKLMSTRFPSSAVLMELAS